MKGKLIYLICLMLLTSKVYAQSDDNTFIVKMDGYLITYGGGLFIFQPCYYKSATIWDDLNNTSFVLWIGSSSGENYPEAVQNIGDSVIVQELDSNLRSTNVKIGLTYFYCTIEATMSFLDSSQFEKYKKLRYNFLYNEKKYGMVGFSVRNFVTKIIPHNKSHLLLLYQYYKNKGYARPDWLEECVNKLQDH